jgi:glycosyltransferase involved in cell wall biosynthesis
MTGAVTPGLGKSSRMRVAMVTRYPPRGSTHAGRGIGSYSRQLAAAIAHAGAEVVVVADRLDETQATYVDGSVTVRRTWREGLSAVGDIRRALAGDPFSIVHMQHELFALGRREGALATVRLLDQMHGRHPVVTTIHGVIPITAFDHRLTSAYAGALPPRVVKAIYGQIMKRVIRSTDLVIVHNDAVLQSLSSYGTPRWSLVLPHGIAEPTAKLTRQEGLEQLGLRDMKRVVFLGFLLPYKGIETLEAAVAELSRGGIEVVIAGGESGDAIPTHKSTRLRNAVGARRMGFVPESLLPALFAVTDVLVLPYSVGLSMSGPLSLAAAYDVPVAVSDVPTLAVALGCPEATFRAGDPVDLAHVVRRVMDNPQVRTAVRVRLAAMRAQAAWSTVAREHISAYDRLVSPDLGPLPRLPAGLSTSGRTGSGTEQ